jgi:hypothetical protein
MSSGLLSEPFQLAIRGLVLGGAQCDPYPVTAFLDGFGNPGVRSNAVDRPGRDGQVPGPQFYKARTLTVAVGVVGDNPVQVQAAVATQFGDANQIRPADAGLTIPLYFTLADPTREFVCYGQPQRAQSGYATLWRSMYGKAPKPFADAVACEFLATDPLFYDSSPRSITIGQSAALADIPTGGGTGGGGTGGGGGGPAAVPLIGWAGLNWTVKQ